MPDFRVGKPRVKLERTTDFVVAAGGTADVPWSFAVYQDPVVWTAASPTQYVIPKTGLYDINLLCWTYKPSVTSHADLIIFRNAIDAVWVRVPQAQVENSAAYSYQTELVAGDVIKLQMRNPTAGPFTLLRNYYSQLSLTRIGPDRWT